MAKEEATLLFKIKSTGTKAFKSIRTSLQNIKSVALGVIATFTLLTAGIVALALKGSEFKEVQNSFRAMAESLGNDADEMLANMKKLSKGTVSELELMKQANTALLLGLPVEKFGDMLLIARSASKATGQTMQFMLQSIVTGLGRGSKLILDNLGIVFDVTKAYEEFATKLGTTAAKLTEAQKKQAFLNKALSLGKANAKRLGGSADSLNDAWERMKALITDLSTAFGSDLEPSVRAMIGTVNTLLGVLNKVFKGENIKEMELRLESLRKKQQQFIEEGSKATGFGILGTKKTVERIGIDLEINKLERLIQKRQEELQVRKDSIAAGAAAKKAQEEQDAIDEEQARVLKEELAIQDFLQKENNANLAVQIEKLKLKKIIALEKDKFKKAKALRDLEAIDKLSAAKKEEILDRKLTETKLNNAAAVATNAAQLANNLVRLTEGNNKAILALAKLAAIASIIVNTEIAKSRAVAELGPIAGSIVVGILEANRAVSIALVLGQSLAEGGIVKATPGGVATIIGEGGQDEAVIPLDDDEAQERLGGGNTFIFQGPVLGDRAQAREFALMLDQELFDLRRNQESEAFDLEVS